MPDASSKDHTPMIEARSALIDGAGLSSPGDKLVELTARLVEITRGGVERGGDLTETRFNVIDDAVTHSVCVSLAADSSELPRRVPDSLPSSTEPSAIDVLAMTTTEVLEAAVWHAVKV